jgi:hypothetical protein
MHLIFKSMIFLLGLGMDDANSPFISLKNALKDDKRIKYHNDYLEKLAAPIRYTRYLSFCHLTRQPYGRPKQGCKTPLLNKCLHILDNVAYAVRTAAMSMDTSSGPFLTTGNGLQGQPQEIPQELSPSGSRTSWPPDGSLTAHTDHVHRCYSSFKNL